MPHWSLSSSNPSPWRALGWACVLSLRRCWSTSRSAAPCWISSSLSTASLSQGLGLQRPQEQQPDCLSRVPTLSTTTSFEKAQASHSWPSLCLSKLLIRVWISLQHVQRYFSKVRQYSRSVQRVGIEDHQFASHTLSVRQSAGYSSGGRARCLGHRWAYFLAVKVCSRADYFSLQEEYLLIWNQIAVGPFLDPLS